MGDECTCEKCQAGSVYSRGKEVWPVGKAEMNGEGRVGSAHDLYFTFSECGISLRQQATDL
jgi:hypothetical protein